MATGYRYGIPKTGAWYEPPGNYSAKCAQRSTQDEVPDSAGPEVGSDAVLCWAPVDCVDTTSVGYVVGIRIICIHVNRIVVCVHTAYMARQAKRTYGTQMGDM